MTYAEWQQRHPQAAEELQGLIGAAPWSLTGEAGHKSEAWAQQQIRFKAAHGGNAAWRNNVGATPARCPDCGEKQRPIRYGLANDSAALNEKMKSSDIILSIRRLITPAMVGTTIAQFGSVEAKRPGWKYTGTPREQAQAAWLAYVASMGGYATFSTGELNL